MALRFNYAHVQHRSAAYCRLSGLKNFKLEKSFADLQETQNEQSIYREGGYRYR